MKSVKITTVLALLLFTVSQGAYAQTDQDTLQKELNDIAAEQIKLRKQVEKFQARHAELQRVENIITRHQLAGAPMANREDLSLLSRILPTPPEYSGIKAMKTNTWEGLDLNRRQSELQILKMELQKQQSEIDRQLEALQRRENEVKRQQEALDKKNDEVKPKQVALKQQVEQ